MSRSFRFALTLCALASFGPIDSAAAKKKQSPSLTPPVEVGFFAAIKAKQIEVLVVPRNSKRLTLTIRNKSKQPLRIQMPVALAAAPIHRQFGGGQQGGGQQGGGQQGGGQQGGAQGLGFGGGGQGQGQGFGQGQGQGQGFGQNAFGGGGRKRGRQNGGFFNVRPDKSVTKRLPCVCLEQGKKDPSPRMKYRIVKLEKFSSDPRLARVLALLKNKKITQTVAQAAAWNLTNRLGWKQLVQLKHRHLNGSTTSIFRINDVRMARTLLQGFAKPKALPKRKSLSQKR